MSVVGCKWSLFASADHDLLSDSCRTPRSSSLCLTGSCVASTSPASPPRDPTPSTESILSFCAGKNKNLVDKEPSLFLHWFVFHKITSYSVWLMNQPGNWSRVSLFRTNTSLWLNWVFNIWSLNTEEFNLLTSDRSNMSVIDQSDPSVISEHDQRTWVTSGLLMQIQQSGTRVFLLRNASTTVNNLTYFTHWYIVIKVLFLKKTNLKGSTEWYKMHQ